MTVAETTELPSLAPPEEDGVAHLVRPGRAVAHCGAPRGRHGGHVWVTGAESCSCGAPICPTCLSIRRVHGASGCWEGA